MSGKRGVQAALEAEQIGEKAEMMSDGSPLLENHQEDYNRSGVSVLKASFLLFRSIVGIGILSMPNEIQGFGLWPALIVSPIFLLVILYSIDCILDVSKDLKYVGNEYPIIMQRPRADRSVWQSEVGSDLQLDEQHHAVYDIDDQHSIRLYASFDAGMFLNWAACRFGYDRICNNKEAVHLIALFVTVPMSLITEFAFFSTVSLAAGVVIVVTGSPR